MRTLFVLERDLDILTKTMYGEARGEYQKPEVGVNGLIAVGNVIINRCRTPNHFGKTIYETCLEPYQFSCWNQNDPNFQIISRGTLDHCRIFRLCKDWAKRMLQEEGVSDLTFGANHYYASSMEKLPKWALGQLPPLTLGEHFINYKEEKINGIRNLGGGACLGRNGSFNISMDWRQ